MSNTMSCESCGRAIAEGDRFCPDCGATVEEPMATAAGQAADDHGTNRTQCVSCKAPMGRDDRFCPKCGASRPEEATVVSHVSLRNTQATHLIEATTGEFEIIQQLGTGAMGAVYLAKDIALGRKVAIKVIAPNLLSDETMISRFRLEAQTVAALRHSNIVNVHAVRQSDDLHYFVMEFIDGPPLRSIIKGQAPLDVDVVTAILFQVGSALSYAHRTSGGVIHRDVKPANIMVDKGGDAFVTDFGISKIAEAQSGLTQTGATIGTPEYMSPEQCRGEALTGASDQYALGIVAYEMLCGNAPFSGSQYHVMVAHTSEAATPIREVRSECPAEVADAVERMLAKSPQDRWPDLDSAVAAMGGAPLPYKSPVRTKIVTLMSVPAIDTGSSRASSGPLSLDTATSVTVSGIPSVIETGDTFELEAEVKGTGEISLGGQGVIWASTDPSIARIESGVVHALKPGTVSITATAGNVANSVLLTVAEPSPAAVLVRPGSVRIQRGGRIGLTATVQDKKGQKMDRPVTWSTTDADVATVTGEGQVVATGSGSVGITATSEGATGTAQVVVEAPVAAPAPATVMATPPVGEPSKPGRAARKPAAEPGPVAKPKPAAKPKARPPRPEPSVSTPVYRRPAAIAASVVGLLAIGFGVMQMGGGEVEPGVVETPPAVDPAPAGGPESAPPTQTADNPPVNSPADGPADEPADVGDNAPASGSEPGVTAANPATVGAAAAGGRGGAQPANDPPAATTTPDPPPPPSNTPPAVVAPTPARVAVALAAPGMPVGGTQSASATVTAAGGARMTSGFTLSWRSSAPSVLAVDNRGTVTARAAGSAWVVASTGNNVRDSALVTVAAVVERVEIADADFSLEVGEARSLSASARDAGGAALPAEILWSSSNPGVAGVDPTSGQVRAVAAGTAQITAAAEGFADEVSVTVEAPAPELPALPAAGAVQSALNGYVSAMAAGNSDEVRRLWGSAGGVDDVIDLMGQRSFAATLGAVGATSEQGAAAVVAFTVNATYRFFAGGDRSQAIDLVARFQRSGSGWTLASVTSP
jgi:serine/threonine protein kinase